MGESVGFMIIFVPVCFIKPNIMLVNRKHHTIMNAVYAPYRPKPNPNQSDSINHCLALVPLSCSQCMSILSNHFLEQVDSSTRSSPLGRHTISDVGRRKVKKESDDVFFCAAAQKKKRQKTARPTTRRWNFEVLIVTANERRCVEFLGCEWRSGQTSTTIGGRATRSKPPGLAR